MLEAEPVFVLPRIHIVERWLLPSEEKSICISSIRVLLNLLIRHTHHARVEIILSCGVRICLEHIIRVPVLRER